MNTCKNCNFENADDATFCSNCGFKLAEDLTTTTDSTVPTLDYSRLKANQKIVDETTCRICNNNFSIGEEIIKCEKCNNYYHEACWVKNDGCNQPGCAKEEDTKACPFCGETIKKSAIKCKHCGNYLDKTIETYAGPSQNAQGAVAALVCGLIGLFLFGFILGFVAIGQGNKALKQIEANPALKGQGMAKAGKVIGIIDIIGWVIAIIIQVAG